MTQNLKAGKRCIASSRGEGIRDYCGRIYLDLRFWAPLDFKKKSRSLGASTLVKISMLLKFITVLIHFYCNKVRIQQGGQAGEPALHNHHQELGPRKELEQDKKSNSSSRNPLLIFASPKLPANYFLHICPLFIVFCPVHEEKNWPKCFFL